MSVEDNLKKNEEKEKRTAELLIANIELAYQNEEILKMEGTLRESEQKLRSVLNNTTDVIWSLSLPDMSVFYISLSVEKLYGQSVEEFVKNPSLLSPRKMGWHRVSQGTQKRGNPFGGTNLYRSGCFSRR